MKDKTMQTKWMKELEVVENSVKRVETKLLERRDAAELKEVVTDVSSEDIRAARCCWLFDLLLPVRFHQHLLVTDLEFHYRNLTRNTCEVVDL